MYNKQMEEYDVLQPFLHTAYRLGLISKHAQVKALTVHINAVLKHAHHTRLLGSRGTGT